MMMSAGIKKGTRHHLVCHHDVREKQQDQTHSIFCSILNLNFKSQTPNKKLKRAVRSVNESS
jgi:hypothetical protein